MHREHHRWYSPALGREMDLIALGHAGTRMLVFPTSMGRFYEWEDRGMADALAEPIERGWLQLYCVDSVDEESWYAKWKRPGDRAWHHARYEAYLRDEVIPLMRGGANPYLVTAGASFGAYHAVAFALRHPHLVQRAIGLSGLYDIREQTDGYSDENVYAFNPADFVAHEPDERIAAMKGVELILAIGQDDPMRGNNEYFSDRLWRRGIWHALRVWDGWAHDWPFWRDMIRLYWNGAK